jgi:DNA polymerase-1
MNNLNIYKYISSLGPKAGEVETVCIETPEAFNALVESLAAETTLAVDTETVGIESYGFFRQAAAIRRTFPNLDERIERARTVYLTQYNGRNKNVRSFVDTLERKRTRAEQRATKTEKAAQKSPSGLHFWENRLGCLQLGVEISPTLKRCYLIRPEVINPLALEQLLNSRPQLLFQNAVFDWKMLKQHLGITLHCRNLFDTKIAEYCIINGRNAKTDLKTLSDKYLGVDLDKTIRVSNWLDEWTEALIQYAAWDVAVLFEIKNQQRNHLMRLGLQEVFQLECSLVPVTAEMEMAGLNLDLSLLARKRIEYETRHEALRQKLIEALGPNVNPDSPKQLLEALQAQGYNVPDTQEKTLLRFKERPLIEHLLAYREVNKVLGTYVIPFLEKSVNGRIFGEFKATGTETGRFSSANPNLQNLPASGFREAFIARDGYVLLDADLSQIELRILAALSQDPMLLKAFRENKDCHAFAASLIYGIPLEQVTKAQRQAAKTIQFGIIYGKTVYGLAQDLDISERQAEKLLKKYFAHYPKVKSWIRKTIQEAYAKGCVKTASGRVRYLPGLYANDRAVKEHAERQAVNTVIQGTAADAMKKGMLLFAERWKDSGLDGRLIATVHDELLLEILANDHTIAKAKQLVKNAMIDGVTHYVKGVPVQVGDAGSNWEPLIANNWGAMKAA